MIFLALLSLGIVWNILVINYHLGFKLRNEFMVLDIADSSFSVQWPHGGNCLLDQCGQTRMAALAALAILNVPIHHGISTLDRGVLLQTILDNSLLTLSTRRDTISMYLSRAHAAAPGHSGDATMLAKVGSCATPALRRSAGASVVGFDGALVDASGRLERSRGLDESRNDGRRTFTACPIRT